MEFYIIIIRDNIHISLLLLTSRNDEPKHNIQSLSDT